MSLFGLDNWLKAPLDRDVIERWTVGRGQAMDYALDLPAPPDPHSFHFLALGDTGDSEAAGPHLSPQDAVAQEMAKDAAVPGSSGQAAHVLHTGDVIYMTGERRLYDRNFRRPYASFLMPESTVDDMVFRIPFLPVPGNHDYYDVAGWARWLTHVPILGAGLRAITHELFAFSLPEGGSDMGRAYMQAFVDAQADTRERALPYRPGERTRLPNRYYKFSLGTVDFFALDSNTLDTPPPWTDTRQAHNEAVRRVQELAARARELDRRLRRHQRAVDRWRIVTRENIGRNAARQEEIVNVGAQVGEALSALQTAVQQVDPALPFNQAAQAAVTAQRRWAEAAGDLAAATDTDAILSALNALDEASDEGFLALRETESCLSVLPSGSDRTRVLAARDALQQVLQRWSDLIALAPEEEKQRIHQLSEEALDVQRELAQERRLLSYRPADYDSAQLQWLEQSLARSQRERPENWRVLYLHHPLYTTISNHCERPDVQGLRSNLIAMLQDRVHLVLSGHSHAFEWLRSDVIPHTGIFVTGGGGQVSLRPSLLEPRRWHRHIARYEALRANGIRECVLGGRGPSAADGEMGLLYHYLRIEVTPDRLMIYPIGVRRLARGYRREAPMPVYHAPDLPPGRPEWRPHLLQSVEIRRDQPPQPHWV